MSQNYCYFNGDILPVKDAHIHISDLGLLRSYAVFDYFRTYKSKPCMLADHLERFRNSAEELRLTLSLTDGEIASIIDELVHKSEVVDVGIRMVITGGYSLDSMAVSDPNFMIIIEPLPVMAEEVYSKGVSLKTYEFLREVPLIKSTAYLNAIKLQPMKEQYDVWDLLYYFENGVLECPRNNFFIFKHKVLITPKDHIELWEADEAFISGTTKRIIPVVKIDDRSIGDGEVGECTKELTQLFDEYIETL